MQFIACCFDAIILRIFYPAPPLAVAQTYCAHMQEVFYKEKKY